MFRQMKDIDVDPTPKKVEKPGEGLRADPKKPSKLERGANEPLSDYLKRKAKAGLKADE